MKKGKNYTKATEAREISKKYDVAEAIAFVKEHASAKFDEAVEVHVRLGIDPKRGEQAIRASVSLPHGSGKTARIAVITESKADEAKSAGADIVGGSELIDEIKAGNLPEADVIVATPEMMPKLASAAKVLGPRGLMPSPKTDTVTPDVAGVIGELKKGKENFKNDNSGNIHQVIGKVSFDADKLEENYKAFMSTVSAQKTDAHKGALITGVSMCSTMGPGLKVKF